MSRAERGRAATSPDATDPRLRGRTCAIPFDDVWQAACTLADGKLARWHVTSRDDQAGVIAASAGSWMGAGHDILIRIGLDEDAQTRIDAEATARNAAGDFGRAARQLGRFFAALDRSLESVPRRTVHRPVRPHDHGARD